jgi:hypothetical protein
MTPSAANLTALRAVFIIWQRMNFSRIKRKAPIVTYHDANDVTSSYFAATPFSVLIRFHFPSHHMPRYTTIAIDCVRFGWERLIV